MQLHDCHKIRIVRKNVLANASREIFPVDGSIKVHSIRRGQGWGKYSSEYLFWCAAISFSQMGPKVTEGLFNARFAVAQLSQNKNPEKKRPGKRKQRNLSGRCKNLEEKDGQRLLLYYVSLTRACNKVLYQLVYIGKKFVFLKENLGTY